MRTTIEKLQADLKLFEEARDAIITAVLDSQCTPVKTLRLGNDAKCLIMQVEDVLKGAIRQAEGRA